MHFARGEFVQRGSVTTRLPQNIVYINTALQNVMLLYKVCFLTVVVSLVCSFDCTVQSLYPLVTGYILLCILYSLRSGYQSLWEGGPGANETDLITVQENTPIRRGALSYFVGFRTFIIRETTPSLKSNKGKEYRIWPSKGRVPKKIPANYPHLLFKKKSSQFWLDIG